MDLKNLVKNNKFNEVYEILISKDLNNINYDFLKHILFKFSNEKKIINIFEKIIINNFDDEALITIGMRIYLNFNDIDAAYKLFKNIKEPKKRNVLPLFKFYCDNSDEIIFNFYKNNLYEKFIIDNDEFYCLLKNIKNKEHEEFIINDMKNNILSIKTNNINLLNKKNSKIVEISNGSCPNCNNKLISIDLSSKEKNFLKSNIENIYFENNKKKIIEFEDFINKNKYDIFIDAGNIIFYQTGKFNYFSFKKIDVIYKELKKKYNVLVIIHKRHFINLKKIDKDNKMITMFKSWNVYETPFKLNDDWYFIYASLIQDNSLIVSNDKLRDHQFKISEKTNIDNTLAKLIDRRVIRYDFKNKKHDINNLVLKFPKNYSKQIQKVNYWHFPTQDDKWLCYKTE